MVLKIKELREESGMTQKELASRIGNLQRNVSNWENGISEPDCKTLIDIADTFDVTLDELLGREKNYGKNFIKDDDREISIKMRKLTPAQKNAVLRLIDAIIQ